MGRGTDTIKERYATIIDRITIPLDDFLKNKPASGILLFISVVAALIWVNFFNAESYHHLWETKFTITLGDFVLDKTIHHWINDGLMAVFFFMVGLEIKRELLMGDLSSWNQAILPVAAALGGMLMPALIFLVFNNGLPTEQGWGIPMATDIAFALGVLSLLDKRVPVSLKIFLTALAIVDDLGAVLVIAFFYTENLLLISLEYGALFFVILLIGNYIGIRKTWFYVIIGILGLWIAFLLSGIHATIAGVLLAFTIPVKSKINIAGFIHHTLRQISHFRKAKKTNSKYLTEEQQEVIDHFKDVTSDIESPLQKMEHKLNPFVNFFVLPLFALSNAGVIISLDTLSGIVSPLGLGIFLGLIVGKFLGIFGFSALLIKLGWASLPKNTTWTHIIGASFMAGIGFTMSIFISELAFDHPGIKELSKVAILITSVVAGIIGSLIIRFFTKKPDEAVEVKQN